MRLVALQLANVVQRDERASCDGVLVDDLPERILVGEEARPLGEKLRLRHACDLDGRVQPDAEQGRRAGFLADGEDVEKALTA